MAAAAVGVMPWRDQAALCAVIGECIMRVHIIFRNPSDAFHRAWCLFFPFFEWRSNLEQVSLVFVVVVVATTFPIDDFARTKFEESF